MDLSEAEFDRIEAFLAGDLSADEQRRMETELAQNHDLQQAVDEHRVIWESLQVPVAVEYFQEMHSQLDEQGLLQIDDFWVDVDQPDDTHSAHPAHHPEAHHEPEVFVTEEPKTVSDDTAHHIDVAVDEDPIIHPDPDHDNRHGDWDNPGHFDSPHSHFDGTDDFL